MNHARISRRLHVAVAVALISFCIVPAGAQMPARRIVPSIPSLVEPGESLTIRGTSPRTGWATFASSSRGILLRMEPSAPAEARAAHFVDTYGAAFGLTRASQVRVQRAPVRDDLGIDHVRLQQVHHDVPVRGAELIVHLAGARVIAANGHIVGDLPDSVVPERTADQARAATRQWIEKHLPEHAAVAQYSEPRLEIFNRAIFSDGFDTRSRLAWFVEATGDALRQFVWVDARSGIILLSFSQLAEGKSRNIHDGQHLSTLPGPLVRSEGGPPTGNADEDNAYTFAGLTYDYFFTNHGRDSFDNLGSVITSTCHHCEAGTPQGTTCPDYRNAGWTGSQMIYADGFASADDVVGHELTHAVTQYSADLFYYMQSGALSESYSDIFGETIDLLDGAGNDATNVRWLLGEDLPGGAIRDMMTPARSPFYDPGKMSDSNYFKCYDAGWSRAQDWGGVHTNSGIPNHAYALMVDGGTYNSTTIAPIGLEKAAKIHYRALTLYLTSGATFADNFSAVGQACSDLVGVLGITAGDCAEVTKALQAVEMNNPWPCEGARRAPPLCPTGAPATVFIDNFETITSNWTATNDGGAWYSHIYDFAKGGIYSAWGTDTTDSSDHRLTMASPVTVPAGGRLYFDHAFEFETGFWSYDGGVLEYSVNNGVTWTDAGSLIDAGFTYNGDIAGFTGNPVGGRPGFVNASHGYAGTRLNLSSLAGQNVRFRFRIGTDVTSGSLGWFVDNVTIYSCSAVASGVLSVIDPVSNLGTVNVAAESSAVIGNSGVVLTDVARTSSGAMWGISFDTLYSINPTTGARTYVGPLGTGGMNALVGNGNGLLAASIESTSLFSVNTATGAATPLSGTLGYPSMGDLAFHGGFLYAAVKNGPFSDLVRITLSGNSFTAMNLGHVTSDNALFGLARGADTHLYGFSGRTVWRINTTSPSLSAVVVPSYNPGIGGLGDANGASSGAAAAFTDDPLIAGTSPIRVIHITELRDRIATLRLSRGLSAYSWTDPTLTALSTRIKAAHVTDLRTALSQVYTAAGVTPPSFTDPSLAGSAKAVHIQQLRAAVIALE